MFVFVLIAAAYFFLLLFMAYILFQIKDLREDPLPKPKKIISGPLVTLLIPFRNEAAHLPELAKDLRQQSLAHDRYEVIWVNDHSDDDFQNFIDSESWPDHWSLVHLKENQQGKKQALLEGINAARAPYILTTDADCRVDKDWIAHYVDFIIKHQPALVFGPVVLKSSTYFEALQQLEHSSLIASAAISQYFGLAGMCNGANLCFEKEKFLALGGYDAHFFHPSGDDEFTLNKFFKQYPKEIHFMGWHSNRVLTAPAKNIKEFLDQRIRWSSKWKVGNRTGTKVLSVSVALLQLFWILTLCFCLWAPTPILFVALGMKLAAELVFFPGIASKLQIPFRVEVWLPLSIIHPFYVMIVAILAQRSSFSWKGRTYRMSQLRP